MGSTRSGRKHNSDGRRWRTEIKSGGTFLRATAVLQNGAVVSLLLFLRTNIVMADSGIQEQNRLPEREAKRIWRKRASVRKVGVLSVGTRFREFLAPAALSVRGCIIPCCPFCIRFIIRLWCRPSGLDDQQMVLLCKFHDSMIEAGLKLVDDDDDVETTVENSVRVENKERERGQTVDSRRHFSSNCGPLSVFLFLGQECCGDSLFWCCCMRLVLPCRQSAPLLCHYTCL